MGTCRICRKKSSLISRELGVCLNCIRCCPEEALEIAHGVHARIRRGWGLPGEAPRHPEGVAKWIPSRSEPPLLIASTLMVPGYIDTQEIGRIAEFIASLDPEIPYSLLAFHPHYKMTDLAASSRNQARESLDAAKQAGLRRVRVGNTHLLW